MKRLCMGAEPAGNGSTAEPFGSPEPEAVVASISHLSVHTSSDASHIVRDISLELTAGKIVGLVGESGSGKTTLALAMLWHARKGLTLGAGDVSIDGRSLRELPNDQLRAMRGNVVAYVPQDPATALNPGLRIGVQLRDSLKAHGHLTTAEARLTRIREVLSEVRLPPDDAFLARYPHQLSGGQQQRVAIAMAFLCRPRLVVLDEPTTGLDAATQRHVLDTVRQMCTQHSTAALYVSHDLAVVASIADHIAVMYSGRIVEFGTPADLVARAAHPYSRKLIAAAPDPLARRRLIGIPGSAPAPSQRPTGCSFAPRCDRAVSRCHTDEPPQTTVAAGHTARCWLALEVSSQARLALTEPRPVAATASLDSVLDIAGLSARYGQVTVLRDIDISIAGGQCLALVGESGSGKTTLSRCVAGMYTTYDGSISFRGTPLPRDARKRNREAKRQLQYIFQNPYSALNPRRTVSEIVTQPLGVLFDTQRSQRADLAAEALDRVGLGAQTLARYPSELSGGQKQRVAIARALVCKPSLLICDEITSALDVSVQASLVELLQQLATDHDLAMLFITHNLPLVRSIADEVVVLQSGVIVERGATETVFQAPATQYTRDLLASTPSLQGAG